MVKIVWKGDYYTVKVPKYKQYNFTYGEPINVSEDEAKDLVDNFRFSYYEENILNDNFEEVLIKINGVGKKTASKIVNITNSKELFLAKGKQFWYNILTDDDVNKIL